MLSYLRFAIASFVLVALSTSSSIVSAEESAEQITKEWTQWGGDGYKNNVPVGVGIPTDWNVGKFDFRTGEWDSSNAVNIKWASRLGSQTYGNAVVADGKVFVGTNNSGGWIARYPSNVDLGCLIAFDRETGDFLWQHSSEKAEDRPRP